MRNPLQLHSLRCGGRAGTRGSRAAALAGGGPTDRSRRAVRPFITLLIKKSFYRLLKGFSLCIPRDTGVQALCAHRHPSPRRARFGLPARSAHRDARTA